MVSLFAICRSCQPEKLWKPWSLHLKDVQTGVALSNLNVTFSIQIRVSWWLLLLQLQKEFRLTTEYSILKTSVYGDTFKTAWSSVAGCYCLCIAFIDNFLHNICTSIRVTCNMAIVTYKKQFGILSLWPQERLLFFVK